MTNRIPTRQHSIDFIQAPSGGPIESGRRATGDGTNLYEVEVEVECWFPAIVTMQASTDEEAEQLAYEAVWNCDPDSVSISVTTIGQAQGIRLGGDLELMEARVCDCELADQNT